MPYQECSKMGNAFSDSDKAYEIEPGMSTVNGATLRDRLDNAACKKVRMGTV